MTSYLIELYDRSRNQLFVLQNDARRHLAKSEPLLLYPSDSESASEEPQPTPYATVEDLSAGSRTLEKIKDLIFKMRGASTDKIEYVEGLAKTQN